MAVRLAAAAAFNATVAKSESLSHCRDCQRRRLVRFVMLEAPPALLPAPRWTVHACSLPPTFLQQSFTLAVALSVSSHAIRVASLH